MWLKTEFLRGICRFQGTTPSASYVGIRLPDIVVKVIQGGVHFCADRGHKYGSALTSLVQFGQEVGAGGQN